MTNKTKTYLLIGISVAAFVSMLSISPIRQDPAFHNFADGREIASIPNFMNVISNLPFLLFGTAGLWMMNKSRFTGALQELKTNCTVFFVGIFFTGIGSAFYHLYPNNNTLVWDRLPMTISFMGFFSFVTGTFIDVKFGKKILWPLLIFGILSVWYWNFTGDLRFYVLVQFLPILLTILILTLFNDKNSDFKKHLWQIILFYVIAKISELLDVEIYSVTGVISGHSLKHLFAAVTPTIFILGIHKANKLIKFL